jgi:Ribbon-helix-helix protein, copG family
MAEVSAVTAQEDLGERLEHVEVELRSPTVVLSVRLDEKTGKQLQALARNRGVRLSEVLREAAVAYAASAPQEQETPYVVGYGRQHFAIGVAAANSQGRQGPDTGRDLPETGTGWGIAVRTGLASVG